MTQQNISQHIESIYQDKELDREATNKKFLLVRQEGSRQVKRNIDHYNLDKVLKRRSCGIHNFKRFRTRILHCTS